MPDNVYKWIMMVLVAAGVLEISRLVGILFNIPFLKDTPF